MATKIPPLNALLAFDAVGRHMSIKLAAESLHVTASAVSQHLKNLENWIGTPLVTREHRAVRLTRRGTEYHREISKSFGRIASATNHVSDATGSAVRIGAPSTFAFSWLMPRLPALRRVFPDLRVAVTLNDNMTSFPFEEVTSKLEDLALLPCDITLRMSSEAPKAPRSVPLVDDKAFAVCSPRYLDQHGPMDASSVASKALLSDAMPETWDQWFKAAGLPRDASAACRYSFSHTHLMLEAAANGLGIALAHEALAGEYLRSGRLVRLGGTTIPTTFRYYATLERLVPGRPDVERCFEWLAQQATTRVG